MADEKDNKNTSDEQKDFKGKSEESAETAAEDFNMLLDKSEFKMPRVADLVTGTVIAASKAEVKLDIEGIITGVVRGPELYEEDEEYADLKPGDSVEATVIDNENENGELELSFRFAGQEKAWSGLRDAYKDHSIIKVKVIDANKGGVLVKFRQIPGFLPVSQLAPENYPRVNGGDKGKILERLRSFIGKEFTTKVVTLDERADKIIFSEKEAWNEKQKDVISKYKVGTIVKGVITAITDFGVFINFGEKLEGLIHISELAWQRIEDPVDLYRIGEEIEAKVISLENSKIFLSAKQLLKDPWEEVEKKYKIGEVVAGIILKVNPFGLFVKLDDNIHGLAHISQLGLAPRQRIQEVYKINDKINFEIVSMEPKDHRLGLAISAKKGSLKAESQKTLEKDEDAESKDKKKKAEKKSKKEEKSEQKKKESKNDKEKIKSKPKKTK